MRTIKARTKTYESRIFLTTPRYLKKAKEKKMMRIKRKKQNKSLHTKWETSTLSSRLFVISFFGTLFYILQSLISSSHSKISFTSTEHKSLRKKSSQKSSPECLLKEAYESGDFTLYSHRSFYDINDPESTNTEFKSQEKIVKACTNSLEALKAINVNHLDIDLVLDEDSNEIIVSHPMEFKRESNVYSPCSLLPLPTLIPLLDKTYSSGNDHDSWFISMEPKGQWHHSAEEEKDAALALPLDVMKKVLSIVQEHKFTPQNCAVIINCLLLQGEEEERLVRELQKYCQLFVGIRRSDPVGEILQVESKPNGFHYDYLMPSVEFHPKHANHEQSYDFNLNKSVFWVVDNEDDLRLVADMNMRAIVSNTPKKIVDILNDPNWCH